MKAQSALSDNKDGYNSSWAALNKVSFVAVLSHRSRSLSGSKLIASWKHLIAAAVQDVCEEKRGIEFKQKRMRVVRFQFQCNKPSIIWHILRLNPFLFCARLSLYRTDHSSFNIFLPTCVPSSQILFPSSNLIFSSIHCERMICVRSDTWTRKLFWSLWAEAGAPQGCLGSLYKNRSSAEGPGASSEVCVSYRVNLTAFSNDHNSAASETTRSLKAWCQLMTKGLTCSLWSFILLQNQS